MPGDSAALGTAAVTGLILAGGAGRRVGGKDKGLLLWRGKTLIEHVHGILSPQVDQIIISCNRSDDKYRQIADTTLRDNRAGYEGPLAGFEAAAAIGTEFTVVVPCDSPCLPHDLVKRLIAPLSAPQSRLEISYAHDGNRGQYLFAAMRTECLSSTTEFLNQGGRAVRQWYSSRESASVDFSDNTAAFANFNSPQMME